MLLLISTKTHIKIFAGRFEDFDLKHVYEDRNMVADHLVKLSFHYEVRVTYFDPSSGGLEIFVLA